VHVFSGIPPEDWTLHATEYFLNRLNLNGSQQDFEPPIADDDIHDVVIHPGSGGKGKNWPIERFHELAATLVESGHAIEWICGPAEDFLAVPEGAQVWQGLSLVQIAQRLASTRQYVGNDSGITHLAALCGCKTVAIFGPTNPIVWAPRGPNVHIVHNVHWPTIDTVIAAISALR
jgi:heptosyltransferase III